MQPAQALIDPLNVIPRTLMLAVSVEPVLPRLLTTRAERTALHFDQPAHRLLSHLRRDIRGIVECAVHKAK